MNISGVVTFDHVPVSIGPVRLNYDAITQEPARGVTVDALDATNAVLASTRTDASGAYLVNVPENTDVRIRVQAAMQQSGDASWDFVVRDNTSGNAIYVANGSLTNSGNTDSTRDLNAPSGWGGSAYTAERVAAPFAILDAIYEVVDAVEDSDPNVTFPQLQVFWSENNVAVSGDISAGQIGTSSYTRIGGVPTILVLGSEDSDTDEYDSHVIVHEFGHYFQDQLSRDESLGGSHTDGLAIDPRLAFSEGFANALSGLSLDDPVYRDTLGPNQASGFSINMEDYTNPARLTTGDGWFDEGSIHALLYDIGDTTNEAGDSLSGGLSVIFDALKSTTFLESDGVTTAFAFLDSLRSTNAVTNTDLDAMAAARGINGTGQFGEGETNAAGLADFLPLYKSVTLGGPAVTVCTTDDVETGFDGPRYLGHDAFVRFNAPSNGSYTITMQRTSGPSPVDPDVAVYKRGDFIAVLESFEDDREEGVVQLTAGAHVLNAYTFDISGDNCYEISVQ